MIRPLAAIAGIAAIWLASDMALFDRACLRDLCLGAGAYTIIDGDTIRRDNAPNIRLWGIDAPEMSDPAGAASRRGLQATTGGQALACDVVDTDRYGRIVGRCYVDGFDLACAMVAGGWAQDWPRYSGGAYEGCAP